MRVLGSSPSRSFRDGEGAMRPGRVAIFNGAHSRTLGCHGNHVAGEQQHNRGNMEAHSPKALLTQRSSSDLRATRSRERQTCGQESTRGKSQLQEVLRFMIHQEYSVKAGIEAVSTHYRVCHESQYFYVPNFGTLTIIFSFLAYENHPYLYAYIYTYLTAVR